MELRVANANGSCENGACCCAGGLGGVYLGRRCASHLVPIILATSSSLAGAAMLGRGRSASFSHSVPKLSRSSGLAEMSPPQWQLQGAEATERRKTERTGAGGQGKEWDRGLRGSVDSLQAS